jgi:hypothetical protein
MQTELLDGITSTETRPQPALVHSTFLFELQPYHCTGYSQAFIASRAVQISRPISGLGG